jgi:hypothetical protein
VWVFVLAAACTAIYTATFAGLSPIWSRLNAVAFADSSHYVQLLDHANYRTWVAAADSEGRGEYQRKTVHHILYLVIGEGVIRTLSTLPGIDDRTAMWLISPILGGLNVLLAAAYFRRTIPSAALATACTILFPLLPGTWVYAAIPESWILSTTAVLLVLNARLRGIAPVWIGVGIGVLALTNFLLLMTVPLAAGGDSPAARVRSLLVTGTSAAGAWLIGLALLGLLLSPRFYPHQFLAATFAFKERFTENLPLWHPGRWIYNGANVLALPFALNQHDLNFGRYAILDTVRRAPLGTAAFAAVAAAWGAALLAGWRRLRSSDPVAALLDPEVTYLAAAFVVAGVVLYYESFLYATMTTPVLLAVLARASAGSRLPAAVVFGVAAIGVLNASQQIATFRTLLGA